MHLVHAHAAGQQLGDLCEHSGVFRETALVQPGRRFLHRIQRCGGFIGVRAVGLDGGIVGGQLAGEVGKRVAGLLHALVIPHGIDQLRQRLRVLPRRCHT